MRRLFEKDKYQGVAALGHHIAALARYLAVHAARVLGNDSTEAVALDGDLLTERSRKTVASLERGACRGSQRMVQAPENLLAPAILPSDIAPLVQSEWQLPFRSGWRQSRLETG